MTGMRNLLGSGYPENDRISRRDFVRQASMLGLMGPLALTRPAAVSAAQQTTPTVPTDATLAPSFGAEGQTRGAGGDLKMLFWQSPTTLSAHTTTRARNLQAAALVTEPLLHLHPDGRLIPCLAKEVPSVANGLLAPDLTAVTYRLAADVVWSDGAPFTARDVVFTWQWIMDGANQAVSADLYAQIAAVEAIDDHTVEVRFEAPQPGWFNVFTSSNWGGIYPEHVLGTDPDAHEAFLREPIGTGPYVVESLKTDNTVVITYAINELYREPTKPIFSRVIIESGGEAATAAQAVCDTGIYDLAPNLEIPATLIKDAAQGDAGELVVVPGSEVEYLVLNLSDPNQEVNEQRSHWQTPHPFLSDRAVRQALALGIDRAAIAEQIYLSALGEPPAANILVGIPAYESTNTSWEFDIARGQQILEDAGWRLAGDVRVKDGVDLALTYVIPDDPQRRQVQAIVVSGWEALGIRVDTVEVKPDIFFNRSVGNDLSYAHMFHDVHQYAFGPATPFPRRFLQSWVSRDGENIAQRENSWQQPNESRYHNPAYDALYDALLMETDPTRVANLLVEMNDLLIDDAVVIPLVHLAADKVAVANTVRKEVIAGGPFEPFTWNIANWNRVEAEG